MKPIKIIIEGSNLSGKSSVLRILEDTLLESTVITIHGYYHRGIKKYFTNDQETQKYGYEKLESLLPLLKKSVSEGVILNRFHLTDAVYLKLFFNINQDYSELERELNSINVALVLLDFDDRALIKRLKERDQGGKAGPWDQDYESLITKRNGYRLAFQKSAVKNKLRVDNSTLAANQAAKMILNWLNTIGSFHDSG